MSDRPGLVVVLLASVAFAVLALAECEHRAERPREVSAEERALFDELGIALEP